MMDTYSFLRQLADSWILLAMFSFFLGAIVWAFRPGSTKIYKDVSEIPFRDEPAKKACNGTCENCAATKAIAALKGVGDV
jgi:cytochrome c oxidase cbb3-type subunit 4